MEQERRELLVHSATTIQTARRGYYSSYSSYQGDRRDIIIVQSFVRRRVAEQKRRLLMEPRAVASESFDSKNTDFVCVDGDCRLMDSCQKGDV
jgi:hypothetical protein